MLIKCGPEASTLSFVGWPSRVLMLIGANFWVIGASSLSSCLRWTPYGNYAFYSPSLILSGMHVFLRASLNRVN